MLKKINSYKLLQNVATRLVNANFTDEEQTLLLPLFKQKNIILATLRLKGCYC